MREWSERELKVIAIVPRCAAAIGLASALFMGVTAFRHAGRLYHRFMLALSAHLCLFSAANVVGTTAIPAGTSNTWGAVGNVTTCSAQGFVLQLSLAAPFYYVLLSLYSFLAVWHNFNVQQYLWVEKWIHVGVHVFPVTSAFYLLSIQAYNQPGEDPGTTCWIDSLPFGCGDNDNDSDNTPPCTRGPQNISQVAGIFAGLPVLFIMVFPAVVMTALYVQVRRHQERIHIPASLVAKQAAVYLFALYLTYGVTIVDHSLGWKADKAAGFAMSIVSVVTINLIGVWFLVVYVYFSMPVAPITMGQSGQQQRQQRQQQHQTQAPQEQSATELSLRSSSRGKRADRSISFNIFDGTNPNGDFAEFIFEGDSEDEEIDRKETAQWSAIQNHV